MSDLAALSDGSLLRYYEDIREQVAADSRPGNVYRFMGRAVQDRANVLLTEIQRRGLNVVPVHWLD